MLVTIATTLKEPPKNQTQNGFKHDLTTIITFFGEITAQTTINFISCNSNALKLYFGLVSCWSQKRYPMGPVLTNVMPLMRLISTSDSRNI